jgi:hypothetical protein
MLQDEQEKQREREKERESRVREGERMVVEWYHITFTGEINHEMKWKCSFL